MAAKITGSMPASAPSKPTNVATDIDCDECGKPMIVRQGRAGPFLGCSGYPKCKNTGEVPAKLLEEMGVGPDGKPAQPAAAGRTAGRDGRDRDPARGRRRRAARGVTVDPRGPDPTRRGRFSDHALGRDGQIGST
jgi:hypothetical protein